MARLPVVVFDATGLTATLCSGDTESPSEVPDTSSDDAFGHCMPVESGSEEDDEEEADDDDDSPAHTDRQPRQVHRLRASDVTAVASYPGNVVEEGKQDGDCNPAQSSPHVVSPPSVLPRPPGSVISCGTRQSRQSSHAADSDNASAQDGDSTLAVPAYRDLPASNTIPDWRRIKVVKPNSKTISQPQTVVQARRPSYANKPTSKRLPKLAVMAPVHREKSFALRVPQSQKKAVQL
jgi:hypothetical protein